MIGEAYPPCTQPIRNLEPILLQDLRLETHHSGKVIFLKTFCAPVGLASIQNAVEDTAGDVDRLTIYNLPSQTPLDKVLPPGAVVAIKQPYYKETADGGVAIRVDHPSDFVMLEASDDLVPSKWRRQPKTQPTAAELKQKGNELLAKKNWEEAASLYSKALLALPSGGDDIDEKEEDLGLRRTLYYKRAQARFRMGHSEFAAQDAIASIIPGTRTELPEASRKLNVKSLYRAGRAYYDMGAFIQAKNYLEQARALDATDPNVIAELMRTKKRLLEQERGAYDFAAMGAAASARKRLADGLDHASFLRNTKVAPAGHRGRGLFATKDIKHGDVVFVEKAFYVAYGDKENKNNAILLDVKSNRINAGTHNQLIYGTIDKMRWNPGQANKYFNLYAGPNYQNDEQDGEKAKAKAPIVGEAAIIDTFRVQAIAQYNGFSCPEVKSSKEFVDETEREDEGAAGIWLHASYANHSCLQNTSRSFIGDMMIVRALRDIKAGEEIFMMYYPPDKSPAERERVDNSYKFQCDCPLCKINRQVPASVMEKRNAIRKQVKDLMAANKPTATRKISETKIKQAEALYMQLEATYDQALYRSMPRLALLELDVWIIHSKRFGSASDAIFSLTRLLRNSGFFTKLEGDRVTIDRTNGLGTPDVFYGAIYSAQAWAKEGYKNVSRDYVAFAKEMYMTLFGEMYGFQKKFGKFLQGI